MQYLYKFEAMTTPCEVTLFTPEKSRADACAKAILLETKRLEKKYSYFDESSYLSQLNRRERDDLDPETKQLLRLAVRFYEKTEHLFDITVATIKELYRHETDSAVLEERLAHLRPRVGCEHFSIKKNRLFFDNPRTTVDFGGLVKEYAVDRAVRLIKKHKIGSALVNFGGDIFALGRKPDGARFRVGIKDPRDPSRHITFFELENEAIATSASYERHYRVGDRTFSHILTARSATESPLSATVIAPTCVESGVYSTALMIDPELKIPYRTFVVT